VGALDELAEAAGNREVESELQRCCRDLFYLGSVYLGYSYLTRTPKEEAFHRENLRWWDEQKARGAPFVLFMSERGGLKTTYQIIDAAQDILRDQNASILFCHAVEEEAQKVVSELGTHFLKNDAFRRLRPEIMPGKAAKRFLSASEFTVRRTEYDRQPTAQAKGAGAEITGAHVKTSIRLDDIIGRRDIEDSQIPKKKSWYRNTVLPVRMMGCRIVVTGTHWDETDPYVGWRKDKSWVSRVRHGRETVGKLDYKGTPVLKSIEELTMLESAMGPDYNFQIMNDPSPQAEKVWNPATCEHMVTLEELHLRQTKCLVIVFTDPAPTKLGSWMPMQEGKALSGEKNYWATCVIALRTHGQRREIILLDGSQSRDWTIDAGLTEVARLMRHWRTAKHAIESYGETSNIYPDEMRKIARREGVAYSPVELSRGSGRAGRKNMLFAALADRAGRDEFLIADTVPAGFLKVFLDGAREWRNLPGGRNSLRFDDVPNVVSFACDPAIQLLTPRAEPSAEEWSPYRSQKADEPTHGSLHVRY